MPQANILENFFSNLSTNGPCPIHLLDRTFLKDVKLFKSKSPKKYTHFLQITIQLLKYISIELHESIPHRTDDSTVGVCIQGGGLFTEFRKTNDEKIVENLSSLKDNLLLQSS